MMKSQSEQGYLDLDDEEPESEQDYLIQIMKSQRVNRNHIDQDSDHQESRVNSVKSLRGKKTRSTGW